MKRYTRKNAHQINTIYANNFGNSERMYRGIYKNSWQPAWDAHLANEATTNDDDGCFQVNFTTVRMTYKSKGVYAQKNNYIQEHVRAQVCCRASTI